MRVRQALLGAIDRDALVADVLGGDGVAAGTPRPADVVGVRRQRRPAVPFDTKAAAKP